MNRGPVWLGIRGGIVDVIDDIIAAVKADKSAVASALLDKAARHLTDCVVKEFAQHDSLVPLAREPKQE